MARTKGSKNKRNKNKKVEDSMSILDKSSNVFYGEDLLKPLKKTKKVARVRRIKDKKDSEADLILSKLIPALSKYDLSLLTDKTGKSFLLENKNQTFVAL